MQPTTKGELYIGFRVTKEIKDKIRDIAKRKGMTVSSVLRQVILKKKFWILIDKDL